MIRRKRQRSRRFWLPRGTAGQLAPVRGRKGAARGRRAEAIFHCRWPGAINAASPLIALTVAAALVVAAVVVLRRDMSGSRGSGLPEAFDYSLAEVKKIDPALIHYRQTGEIPLDFKELRGVAVGPGDRIYVAGDKAVQVFEPSGAKFQAFGLEGEPRCLAAAGADHAFPGRLYVGMKSRVEVLDSAGKRVAVWEDLGPKAILTSIAVAEHDVFVADAGNRIVLRYDPAGKLVRKIGQRDPDKQIRGFVIPSPYFDVALTADGLVRVVNPGYHRIEAFTANGDLETFWGKHGEAIDRFCGCCNPTHLAVLPDGRFITSEKGIPRVKIYSAEGQFVGVVAGPDTLAPTETILEETRPDHKLPVFDVAADSRGRVLVLDPLMRKVRIFESVEGSGRADGAAGRRPAGSAADLAPQGPTRPNSGG